MTIKELKSLILGYYWSKPFFLDFFIDNSKTVKDLLKMTMQHKKDKLEHVDMNSAHMPMDSYGREDFRAEPALLQSKSLAQLRGNVYPRWLYTAIGAEPSRSKPLLVAYMELMRAPKEPQEVAMRNP